MSKVLDAQDLSFFSLKVQVLQLCNTKLETKTVLGFLEGGVIVDLQHINLMYHFKLTEEEILWLKGHKKFLSSCFNVVDL